MIEHPNSQQIFAIGRRSHLAEQAKKVRVGFEENPTYTHWHFTRQEKDGSSTYTRLSKEYSLELIRIAEISLDRALRDAGLEDAEWAEDYKAFLNSKSETVEELPINMDREGHKMAPRFRERSPGVLYWYCTICHVTKFPEKL